MRFSAVFQLPLPQPRSAQPAELVRTMPAAEASSDNASRFDELPEDLDERVRRIGEWQLGDA